MRFKALEGKRVAVWGHGREGRAALAALRTRLPGLPLTVFCADAESADIDPLHTMVTCAPDADALASFDVVIKSPGISIYKPEIIAAKARGTLFTSGTALWFGEHPEARVVGVTGTKGKSTTSALVAHLARGLGIRTALAGNIGMPLLDLDADSADLWVVELSSYQTGEAGPLAVGVITSLYEEHTDWHGSVARYVADKLQLVDHAQMLLVNATQPTLMAATSRHPSRSGFGQARGWHIDGESIWRGREQLMPLSALTIPGTHNALNACAALAALELLDIDARAGIPALKVFRPLPHRLQPFGLRDGCYWINDSISTTPQATLAALRSLGSRPVTVLVGGHDRGLDWSDFATATAASPPHAIVAQGANAARIVEAVRSTLPGARIEQTADLAAAVEHARAVTPSDGVVLLSPGAPSFDQFHDYAERGRRFAMLAGFDTAVITDIHGLGIS